MKIKIGSITFQKISTNINCVTMNWGKKLFYNANAKNENNFLLKCCAVGRILLYCFSIFIFGPADEGLK